MAHSDTASDGWRVGVQVTDQALDTEADPPPNPKLAVSTGRLVLPKRDVIEAADRLCRFLDRARAKIPSQGASVDGLALAADSAAHLAANS